MTSPQLGAPPPGSQPTPRQRKPSVLIPGRVKPASITIVSCAAVLVIVQIVNMSMGYRLSQAGIVPRTLRGLWGVADAPLLHNSWGHLASNIVPFLILGFLILIAGLRQFLMVTLFVWLISGLGVWLTASSGTVTVGASTLVFGWLAFMVLRGFFSRHLTQIVVGVVLLALWGGIFWGVLPGHDGISWQGHLFGALAGALVAFLVAKADAPRHKSSVTTSSGSASGIGSG